MVVPQQEGTSKEHGKDGFINVVSFFFFLKSLSCYFSVYPFRKFSFKDFIFIFVDLLVMSSSQMV